MKSSRRHLAKAQKISDDDLPVVIGPKLFVGGFKKPVRLSIFRCEQTNSRRFSLCMGKLRTYLFPEWSRATTIMHLFTITKPLKQCWPSKNCTPLFNLASRFM